MANDIIDINVTEIVETVAITVNPNLTTVNINKVTSTGGGNQDLQSVTDLGATTTNTIIVNANDNAIIGYAGDSYIGVFGYSADGYGVIGDSTNGNGVCGNTSNGNALYAYSNAGVGLLINGNGTEAIVANLGNSNKGIVINSGTSSTGNPIEINKNGVDKLVVNQAGELTAQKLIKAGGTSAQYLMADGSVSSGGGGGISDAPNDANAYVRSGLAWVIGYTKSAIDTLLGNKVDKVTGSRLITSAESTVIGNTSGTNTGDSATNIQYSGLSSSKEDTSNKSTSIVTDQASNIKFPSVKSVYDWAISVFTTTSAVATQITTALTGYATQSWVNSQGYQTSSQVQAIADAEVSDTAYDSTTWNGVTGIAPSKNAVRDKIETLLSKNVATTYTTNTITTVTAAEYAAIGTKDATTLYFIV